MKYKKIIKTWVIPFGIALVISSILNIFIFRVVVPTESMSPTIKKGSSLIASRFHKNDKIERGDILVFHSEELKLTLIKRVIGLPGEKVSIDGNGTVYINDKLLEEKYVVNPGKKDCVFEVPSDCYLFLGDNRNNSYDSRYWSNSYISIKDIKGKFLFSLNLKDILK